MKINKKSIKAALGQIKKMKDELNICSKSSERESVLAKELQKVFPSYASHSEQSSRLMLEKLLTYNSEKFINMATPAGVPVIKSFSNTPLQKKSPVLGVNHHYSIEVSTMKIVRTETYFS